MRIFLLNTKRMHLDTARFPFGVIFYWNLSQTQPNRLCKIDLFVVLVDMGEI